MPEHAASRTCSIHGDTIVDEPGGPDMPTVHGRSYCPTCQRELNEALDRGMSPSSSDDK